MKLLNVIFINLLITIAEILSADERCALQNVHGEAIHITHPTDCHKFYKCDESHNLHEEICPSNLEYNPHLKVCVYNNSGFCMINSTKTVQSVYNCSSFEDGFKIPNYDDNCRSYVECSNGISKIEICENEQVYDSLKGDCITQNENFKCEKMQKSQFQISNVLKSDNITFYPNFDNQCRSYIQCNFNKCKEIFCENNKLFNAATNICEENTKVVCSQLHRVKRNSGDRIKCLSKNINQKCVNGQYEPDDCSCRNFHLCVSGTWRLQTCEPDKYFSKKDNFCVPNDGSCEEECQHGEYKENENNCAQFSVCVYGKWRLQTCSLYQYFDKTVNYCVPDTNNICPDTQTTTKPNCNHGEYKEISDDCTGFYLCVSGIWRLQKCKKDQYFNKELNYCVPEDGTCRPTTHPTSPTPPTKPSLCVHGEYKEDVEDCQRFYLCVNGQSWRRQICNKDQYFNPKLNYCVPEDGTCRPTTQPTSPTPPTKPPVCIHGEYKEDVEDCQRFYLCVNGQSWRRQICNKDQYFNPKLNYCVPEDGTCRPTTQPTSPTPPTKPPVCIHGEYKEDVEDCQRFYLCVNEQWRRQICNKDQYFNPKLNYCVPEDGTCRPTTQPTSPTPPTKPPVCIHGEYKEDVKDCERFYLCVNGQWRRQICNKDQYFNPKLNYCVPEDGTCRPTTQPTSPTLPTKPPICVHGEYKEDVEDCQRFYLCVIGQWRRQNCNKDQYFNPKLNYCVPEDGTCRPTTQPTSPTPPTKPPVCIHGEYKEDVEDCQRFYLCVIGKWRRQICNKDQYFNSKLNYCVPEDGTCRPTTSPTTPTAPTKPPICVHGEYKEDVEDCQRFYLCVIGQWRRQICNKDQYFNPKLNYCVPEDGSCRPTTVTTPPTTPKPECIHGQYRAHKECTHFEICVLGFWRLHSCSPDQYFDKEKNYCVPEDGTCKPTRPTTHSTQSPTTPTTKRTTPTTSECITGEYRGVANCIQFELCVLGHWRLHSCGNNKYFDRKKNYCVPEDGSCRPTTPTTTEKTTPTTPTITTKRTTPISTTISTTPKPKCIHGEYKEHHDCTRFWLCVSGHWREQSCPDNQYFDTYKNYCVPEDGSCRPTTPTTTTEKTTPTTPTTTTEKTTPTTPRTTTEKTTPTTPKTTTKRTTPIPECPHGEFKEHHDCTRFWLCVSGHWREQSCPNNQYFDKYKNYCVPEDGSCRPTTPTTTEKTTPTIPTTTTEKTTPTTPTTTTEKTTPTTPKTTTKRTTPIPECPHGEFKEHHDCTRFWLCVSGHWREQSCPDNQYFDKYKNYCVPEDGSCRPTTPTTTTEKTTPTTPTTTTEKTTPTTPKTTTKRTTPIPECPHGEFKEHHDCTRFWLCVSGHWREQSCPNNQYFDKYKNYCVPEDGSCRPTTPTTTTEKTTPTTPTTTTEKTTPTTPTTTTEKTTPTTPKTTTKRTTPIPECPHGEFKEHHDCTRFWLCVSGHWREQSCPDNQYFDEYKNYCVPEDGSCRPTTPTTTTEKTTPTTPTTTTEKTTPTTPKTTTKRTTPIPECPHGEFKEHHDCTRFWLCVSGHWREQSCPNNQYFDKYKNYCVPEDGSCRPTTPTTTTEKATPTTPTTTTEKTTPTTPKTTTKRTTPIPECPHGEFKEHHDCTRFWLCVSGHWREQSCPNNQYFDKYKNYCVPEDGSCRPTTPTTTTEKTTPTTPTTTTEKTTPTTPKTTTKRTTPIPECPHGEFKEHHDCTRFWLCVSGHWREQSCPNNQYFDKYKNYCVPEDGSCRPTTPTTTTEKTTPTTPTTTTKRTTPTTSTTTTTTTSTTPIPECPHGEFKEHHDCTRFWLCVSGHWREQSCPNNQYFDKYKNYCVPEDGSCRPTTPTTTTEKTTPTTPTTTTKRTTPSTTTKRTTPTTTSTTEKPECPHGEFKEHHDCTRFWLCVSGHWREQSCPNNQYFDKYKNYCVPEDGSCRPTTPTTTTEKTTPTTPTTTTKRTTPTTSTTTTTTTSTTPIPECPHGEFKEHHDCTRFWLCVSGHWREQSCPNNQYFDKYKNYCVPEDGSCRPTTPTTTTEKTTPTTPTTTTEKTTPTTPTTTTEKTTPTTPKTTTKRTTPIPECPHGEFKEHHDCTRFWLCVSGHWREQSCPNNQYFDKYKNYCVPEDGSCRPTTPTTTTEKTTPTTPTTTTKRTTPTTSTTTTTTTSTTPIPECPHGEFKEHHDCTRFWLCVSGHWREQSCPNNQYFDKYKNYCVPEDGSCRPTTPTTTTEKTTPTTPTTTTKRTTPTTTSTTEKPECPHGEFKEHHDCTRFWLCVSGHWREQSCPNNQYFDKYKNYCVPEDGSCRPTTPTTTTEKTTPTTPTTTTEKTTPTTPTTTTKRTTPIPECPHGEFKEHHDCTRFWLCVSGHWREQSCPNNQYFDKYKNYCVPEDGSCRPTTPTTTTEKTTPTTPTTTTKRTTPSTTTKRTTPTTTSTTEKPECPHGEFEEHHDCTRFWLCVSGHWREQSCPNNQYFDKYKNYCVPEDGSCRPTTPTTTTEKTTPTTPTTTTKRTTPSTTTKRTTPTTTSTTEKPECPHGEFKEHHDCTRFWLCVSGHWREQSCPNNQYFDKYKNYCVPEDGSCRPTTPTTTTEKTTPTTPTTTTKRTTPSTTTKRTTPTTTSTTEKPECPHGEFKEHHDCTRFWLCVSGHWREQSCPNNQYFDKYKNYCVPEDGSCRPTTPTTTEKTTPTTPTTTTKRTTPSTTTKRTTPTTTSTTEKPECPHGEFKEHHDCTRFWLCVSGHWREQSCPNNQYFDKYKNYCVPEDGSCRPTTPTTTTAKTTPTTPTTTTKITTPSTTTKRTTPTTTSTTEKPECPHGEFKEHHDCTRFWLCVSGHWREQSCPNNQYFDKYKNYCVPEDGSCRPTTPTTTTAKTTPTTPTTTTKITTPSTTTKRTTPTTTSTTEKPECPHGEFKEHHDCTRFWLCVSGHWREQSCPNNQYFDKYKNYCVPEDGSCRPTTPTTTTAKTTPTTPTTTTKITTPSTTTKRTTPTTTSTTEKPECPHGEFKEHHDCTRFWLCVSGHWREQSCPINQYFDKYKNYCVPEDGSCRPTTPTTTTEKTTPTTPTTTTTKRTTPTTTSTTEKPECPHGEFKEHHDCTRFWLCVSGHWREQSCPNNQYFDKYKNYCVPEDGSCRPTTPTTTTEKTTPTTPTTTTKRTTPSTTTKRTTPTTTSTTEKPECPHGEFKEHHDCTRFWLCVSGHWREQSCPNNQYFDKYKNYCVPEDGSCRPTTPTTTTEKTTPTTPTTTTKITTPTTTSTTEKPECPHGEFKEHHDCTRFWLCVSGHWREQSCPNNQYFDKYKNYCVPEDGSCRPTTPTTTTEKTTPTTPTTTTKRTTPSTTTKRTTPTTTSTTEKPECPHGEFKEHHDCTRFWLCVSGHWREQSCPNNQYFDKYKNYCVPEDGSCRPTTPTTTTEKTTPTTPTTTTKRTTPSTTTKRTTPTTTSTTEKPECPHGEFKEHHDCTRFWLCVSGHWREQSCPNNQYFDKYKNYCVPEDGSCRPTTPTTTTEKTTPTTPTTTTKRTTPSTTTKRTTPTTTSTTEKPECPHGEFKEHHDCTRFWLCVSGHWREQSCPNNQYFDKYKNYCVPEDGSCRPTTPTTTTAKTTPTTPTTTTKRTTPSTTTKRTTPTTTSTTEKPECPHGEFKEHHDCTRFWLCVSGHWREQSCPNNQYFDKYKNYCVPEDGSCRPTTPTTTTEKTTPTTPTTTTKRTTPSTTTKRTTPTTTSTTEKPECPHGEFKEHHDCTRFWLCVSGHWREQSCPNNQYFDKYKNYCVPEDGSCRPTTPTTTTEKTTPTTPTTTTKRTTPSTTTKRTTPTTTSTTEKPECPHGEFKEHHDCTRFWLCVSGHWREQSCPNNQYFDKYKNYCVPEDGSCRPTTPTTTTEKTTPTTPTTTTKRTTPSTTTKRTTPTTTSTTEKPECPHGEFKEHHDCTRFWLCVSGHWREQSCPNNQYFDKYKNYCVPEDGSCRPTTPTTTTKKTTPTTTTKITTPTTTTKRTTPTTTSTTEKPECPHGEFKEHHDCTRFWLCVSGHWREQSCPNNQYFDKYKNYCVPEDGSCRPTTPTTTTEKTTPTTPTTTTKRTTPSTTTKRTTPTTTSTTEKPECPHGEFKEHHDCTRFWLCVSGHWREQSCPNNQYFDKYKNYCVPEDGSCRPTTPTTTTEKTTPTTPTTTTKITTPTTTSTTEKPECPHGEFKEHHDCTRFWLCVSGHWREQSCPNNQYFDNYKNYCVPEDGSCRPTTPTTTTEKTTPTTPTTTTKRTTPSTTTKRTTPTTTSTTEKPECPHGEFKEHHDCTRFWLCVSGHWREQSCPNNQYFDKYKNYCVPEDGSCRPTTPTTTTEKTTPTTPTTTTKRTTPSSTTKRTTTTTTSTTGKPECHHGEFKEHHDCARFWLCVSGRWREQSCPNNQYFDKYKNYCVPEDGSCRPTTPTTTTKKTTPSTPATTTKRTTPTTTPTKTTRTTPSTPTTTGTSPIPQCRHGEYRENPSDCTKFFLCVLGIWRTQTCSDGQYFNPKLNYCVPEDGSCRPTKPTVTTTVTTPKPKCVHGEYREYLEDCTKFEICVLGIWRTQVCSNNQYFNPKLNYCVPEDGSCRPTKPTIQTTLSTPSCRHGEYKENLSDCTAFYLCVVGVWRNQYCSDGQYFNPKLNYCVPEDGSCRPTKPTVTTTIATPRPKCVHGEYREYPEDCTKFEICVLGIWRTQVCSNNQYFNSKLNYCIPEDGSCRPTKPTVTTTITTPKPKCVHGQYRENPNDCTKFYLCVSGEWRDQNCSKSQYFSKTLNYCIPEDGSCRPTPKPKCIHGEYKEDPSDCTKFYLCVSGEWRDQNCSKNQYFNKKLNYCIPEDGSCRPTPKPKCIHGEYKEDPNDCTKFYLCVSGEWRDQNCSKSQYFSKTLNYCIPEDGSCRPTPKPKCIHGEYKEDPSDCTKFYLCVSGEWRNQLCRSDNYFNKSYNYCIPEDGTCNPTKSCIHGEYREDPKNCFNFHLCVNGIWREQKCQGGQYFNKNLNICVSNDGSCKSSLKK